MPKILLLLLISILASDSMMLVQSEEAAQEAHPSPIEEEPPTHPDQPTGQFDLDHKFVPPDAPAYQPGRQPNATPGKGLAEVCVLCNFGDPDKPNGPLWPGVMNAIAEGKDDHLLYSTSPAGGKHGRGTVFKMTLEGEWTVTHDFDFTTGSGPLSGLVRDPDGYFYGTTYSGGDHSVGTVFSVPPGGGAATVVTNFRNGKPARKLERWEKDYTEQEKLDWGGSYPISAPVLGANGQWVGVTSYSNNQKYGILYNPSGDIPHGIQRFDGISTGLFASSVFAALDGNIYGVSYWGKPGNENGMVFKGPGIQPIHYFNYTEGSRPLSIMLADNNKLVGTTIAGGPGPSPGNGLIYTINPDGSGFNVIHNFTGPDGSGPYGQLVQNKRDHLLYGNARYGGSGRGVVFRIGTDGEHFEVLHRFSMRKTGRSPMGNLMQHSNGYFYGTTYQGGKFDSGVVFRLNPYPTPYEKLVAPGRRWCCSLGQGTVSGYGGDSLDPNELSGHVYGWTDRGWQLSLTDLTGSMWGDRPAEVGYVYTTYGGLVDIGHVRDMADMVKYVYDMLMAGEVAFYLFEGAVLVEKPPADQFEALDLAGAIAYVESWAHELTTWGDGIQHASSFSPEDLSSNIIGIELGKRAITNGCAKDFNKAVDIEMAAMMKELDAQSKLTTVKARFGIEQHTLQGTDEKWFKETVGTETLIRRNFTATVWKILPDPKRYVPHWLHAGWFQSQYPKFKYGIGKPVRGTDGVKLSNMPAATQTLKQEWLSEKENYKMDQWPYNY